MYLQGSNVSLTYDKIKEYVSSYFDKINEAPRDSKFSAMLGPSMGKE